MLQKKRIPLTLKVYGKSQKQTETINSKAAYTKKHMQLSSLAGSRKVACHFNILCIRNKKNG